MPQVLYVWLGTFYQTITLEEQLLNMDAIIVGGGNTLNIMAIWETQGIDTNLNEALNKGVVYRYAFDDEAGILFKNGKL